MLLIEPLIHWLRGDCAVSIATRAGRFARFTRSGRARHSQRQVERARPLNLLTAFAAGRRSRRCPTIVCSPAKQTTVFEGFDGASAMVWQRGLRGRGCVQGSLSGGGRLSVLSGSRGVDEHSCRQGREQSRLAGSWFRIVHREARRPARRAGERRDPGGRGGAVHAPPDGGGHRRRQAEGAPVAHPGDDAGLRCDSRGPPACAGRRWRGQLLGGEDLS